MIKNKNIQQNLFLNNLLLFFFCTYPITFLLGNFAINLFLFVFNLLFIWGVFKKYYSLNILNKNIQILLLFIFLTFLINLFFSNNFYLTYLRVLKFILIIGSILAFRTLIINCEEDKIIKIYKTWSLIFLLVILDVIYELIFGVNILGLKSIIPGRVASFTGDELNIGHFFSAFCLIFISFQLYSINKNSLNLLIAVLLILISFLIGERSNFIKTLIIISIFIFFIFEIKKKYKILSLSSLVIFLIVILNINPNYKLRYFDQFTSVLSKEGIHHYLDNSIYGAHFKVAEEIFKDNIFFGVGIKNFRVESFSDKYDNIGHKHSDRRATTHPHQVHYEFLSETGLFGYLSFGIFIILSFYFAIKSYLKNKNLYQLSGILYVMISLLPLLPTGSFFSTYSSSLFWLNYAIMVGYIQNYSKS